MDTTLASVMKNIAEALQLDYNNKLEVRFHTGFSSLTESANMTKSCSLTEYTIDMLQIDQRPCMVPDKNVCNS